jgi:hypothetical protein
VKVAILVSPSDIKCLVPLLERLKAIEVPAIGVKIGEKWTDLHLREIENKFRLYTHFLFIMSEAHSEDGWFRFFSGFALGKEKRTAIYRLDPDWNSPSHLGTLPVFDTVDELGAFFIVEKGEWLELEGRRLARAELLSRGIPFHAESFAECVREGDKGGVRLFLDAGLTPNARDRHGVPVLCLAARHRHRGIVELLIDSGADINSRAEDRGFSALMDAASAGAVDILSLLITRGAKTELLSKDGQTALIVAVGRSDPAAAKILLDAGSDPNHEDKLGFSAKKYAKLFNKQEILDILK